MIISNNKHHDLDITINGNKISRVSQEKFLGVLIDDKLTFNAHRQAIAKKIANNCGVLFRARHILSKISLNTLYYSFIQSHMIYCSSVWGLGSKNSLSSIFVSQKRAVRTMTFTKLYKKDKTTGLYTYGHTKSIFNEFNLLNIHNLILTQALNLIHKIKLGAAPIPIVKLFNANNHPITGATRVLTDQQTNRLRRIGINQTNVISRVNNITPFFKEPCGRLKIRKNSFVILGPKLYNYFTSKANSHTLGLKNPIRHENICLNGFKKRMKNVVLNLQSGGEDHHWEPDNYPLYTMTNRDVVLRGDYDASVT